MTLYIDAAKFQVDLGRFRIRLGNLELEYEGEDANSKFDGILDWAKHQKEMNPSFDTTAPPIPSGETKQKVSNVTRAKSRVDLTLPKTGKLGILEFGESEVRFPSSAINTLHTGEAIALLLCEAGRPMKKQEIDYLLNRGFKQVRADVSQNFLAKKKYSLARMVIRENDGYRLTGEGEAWVRDEIAPKVKDRSKE